jgi:8-hydroxy-5-deazaflavin:NADPH oxidoreductase
MGSRTSVNEKAAAFAAKSLENASHGTFSDAAAFGEIIFNCVSGAGSIEAFMINGQKVKFYSKQH